MTRAKCPDGGAPCTEHNPFCYSSPDELGGALEGIATGTSPETGCDYTFRYTGIWEITAEDTMRIEYTFASLEARVCDDPTARFEETPFSAAELEGLNAALGGEYELTETTLIVRQDGSATTYARTV